MGQRDEGGGGGGGRLVWGSSSARIGTAFYMADIQSSLSVLDLVFALRTTISVKNTTGGELNRKKYHGLYQLEWNTKYRHIYSSLYFSSFF